MSTVPVRIGFVITELDEGGAERALVQIVTRLDRAKWEPRVFSIAGRGPLTDKLEEVGVPVFDCGANRASSPLDIWKAYSRLKRELKSWQPQVVQTFLFHANILGRLAAHRAGVPHILSGIRVADRRGRWRLRVDRWTEEFVEKHVCVSRAVADFSVKESGLDSSKIEVIPNGVDLAAFQDAQPFDLSTFGVPTEAKVVLSVGRLDPQKAPLTLLAAFSKVAESVSDTHLVLAGAGPLEQELRQEIERRKLTGRVHLIGWQRDVAGLLKAADVFTLASKFEGMPNAVLEAGAAGVPVVTTAAEGVAEILKSDDCGWRVGIGDVDGLANAMEEALTLEDAQTRATKLQSFISERFTWDEVVSRYDQLFLSLLG